MSDDAFKDTLLLIFQNRLPKSIAFLSYAGEKSNPEDKKVSKHGYCEKDNMNFSEFQKLLLSRTVKYLTIEHL